MRVAALAAFRAGGGCVARQPAAARGCGGGWRSRRLQAGAARLLPEAQLPLDAVAQLGEHLRLVPHEVRVSATACCVVCQLGVHELGMATPWGGGGRGGGGNARPSRRARRGHAHLEVAGLGLVGVQRDREPWAVAVAPLQLGGELRGVRGEASRAAVLDGHTALRGGRGPPRRTPRLHGGREHVGKQFSNSTLSLDLMSQAQSEDPIVDDRLKKVQDGVGRCRGALHVSRTLILQRQQLGSARMTAPPMTKPDHRRKRPPCAR